MQLAGDSCVKLFAREVAEAVPVDPAQPRRIFATSRGTRFERAWIQVQRGKGEWMEEWAGLGCTQLGLMAPAVAVQTWGGVGVPRR